MAARCSGQCYASTVRQLLPLVLGVLVSSTAWADYQAICVPRNVSVNRAHWKGPIRKDADAAQRDADAHLKSHPGHPARVSRVEKDVPSDGPDTFL